MAEAFPQDRRFVGYDFTRRPIEQRTHTHKRHGVRRTGFVSRPAPAKAICRKGFDLITMFDCLHDMGDPRAARRTSVRSCSRRYVDDRGAIAATAWRQRRNPVSRLILQRFDDDLRANLPAQEVGEALGAQAGERS